MLKPYQKILTVILLQSALTCALAAPPFYTDDADPATFGTSQTYFFASGYSAPHSTFFFMPAIEEDLGIFNNLEFHTIIPMATFIPKTGGNTMGLSDSLIGLKWRFLTETDYRPEMAIVPDFVLPTGDADRQLGNGRPWSMLPIWLEKHIGPWTTYAGGGYGFNSAPGATNFIYGGWLVQRDFSPQLSLGAEVYAQSATTNTHVAPLQDTGHYWILNVGGSYNFNAAHSFVFSLGHNFLGTQQWDFYLGYLWNIDLIKQKT